MLVALLIMKESIERLELRPCLRGTKKERASSTACTWDGLLTEMTLSLRTAAGTLVLIFTPRLAIDDRGIDLTTCSTLSLEQIRMTRAYTLF